MMNKFSRLATPAEFVNKEKTAFKSVDSQLLLRYLEKISMKLFLTAFVLAFVSLTSAAYIENYLLSDEFISHINSKAKTWTAGRNFHPETSDNYIKGLLGLHPDHKKFLPASKPKLLGYEELPKGTNTYIEKKITKFLFPTLGEIHAENSDTFFLNMK